MFDILPVSASSSRPPRRRRGAPRRPLKLPNKQPQPLPRTLKLQWQLPARLRRPVRQELARQRRLKGAPRFERRPLITKLPGQPQGRRAGDIAKAGASSLHLPPPPYQGSFAKTRLPATRLAMPLELQLLTPRQAHLSTKKKLWRTRNLALFGIGILALAASVGLLQGAGRGVSVLAAVEAKARAAYQQVAAGRAALAETDFDGSEQAFTAAAAELKQARAQLDEALSASRAVLEIVDVTGTVRSGRELLVAGESLANAGEHLARGLESLFTASWLPKGDNPTIVDAVGRAQPELASAVTRLEQAEAALAQVQSDRLPDDIRSEVEKLQRLLPGVKAVLQRFLDHTGLFLNVLGADRDRQYLLLFENNHELRPTGGFIGSLALVNVRRGVVEDIAVQSVYDPDGQLNDFIAPPDPLRFITERWFLRDANWFVDYPTSARKVADFLEKEKGPTVDGVIALTPEVIRELLRLTGPLPVPEHQVTLTADNFVALTQDEVTYSYDRSVNRPKQFLADIAPLLLNRLFTMTGAASWQSLGVLERLVAEKQLLVYFRDPELQERVVAAGWGGAVEPLGPGFLAVNNANIGGHKTDQFIEQEIDYHVTVQPDFSAEVVVTIQRSHHGPEEKLLLDYPAGDNPATKDNIVWSRVLVSKGAELLDAHGFTAQGDIPQVQVPTVAASALTPDPSVMAWQQAQTTHPTGTVIGQEAGLTFFANWMRTPPGETTVGVLRYRLPPASAPPGGWRLFSTYALHLFKQPGDTRTIIRANLKLPEAWRVIRTVPADGVTYVADNEVVYRGALKTDTLVGVITEKK